MIEDNSNLARLLRVVHKRLRLEYDFFGVISGDEGKGKSRGILLPCAEYWYKKVLEKKEIPKYAISSTLEQFVKNLKKAEKYDLIALDEAGDALDTQEYANRLNRALYQAYTVIRERYIFTLVVLPSFFDLNPRFRKRRVSVLVDVYKRVNNVCRNCNEEFTGPKCPECGKKDFKKGYVCYKMWNRRKLNEIIAKNESKPLKKLSCGVKPVALGICQEYTGAFIKSYKIMKDRKTKESLNKLHGILTEAEGGYVCKHEFRHMRRTNSWYCRKCGFEAKTNPFAGGGKT